MPAAVVASVTLAAGCSASPDPAVESPSESLPAPIRTTDLSVTVAMDGIGPGFNPHLLVDQTPATDAIADLVLPSMFRLAPDPADPAALSLQPDTAVLKSADVVSEAPFTVEYRLDTEAQWSDGAPIAVEDFRYLWQEMTTEPGVVAPAGYRQITDIQATGGGGKTVQVVFAQPYPAWRGLFSDMVPAHLLKDLPGGFETGLTDDLPVSGSRFKVSTVDRGRGQILLERNDRFWGPPATPDQIVFRRAGTPAQTAEALRGGDVQVLDIRGGDATLSQLSIVDGVHVRRAGRARALSLSLNARTSVLDDKEVRGALLDLLDPQQLALIGGGSRAGARWIGSATTMPTDAAYRVSAPPRMSRDQAQSTLRAAGYDLAAGNGAKGDGAAGDGTAGDGAAGGGGSSDAPELHMRIGVPRGDETAAVVAGTIADVWNSAGVDATVAEIEPARLYGTDLVGGNVDAVVGWDDADGDVATRIASRFGCDGAAVDVDSEPPDDPATGPGGSRADGPSADAHPAPAPSTPRQSGDATGSSGATTPNTEASGTPAPDASRPTISPVQPAPTDDPIRKNFDDPQQSPSNFGGICDEDLRPIIEQALRGEIDDPELVDAVDPAVWSFDTTLPIMQDTGVIGFSNEIEGIMLGSDRLAGELFVNAAGWHRTRR